MAALSAAVQIPMIGPMTKLGVQGFGASYPEVFYAGAVVWTDAANGLAQTAGGTTGDRVIGICAETVTTTAANQIVNVYVGGLMLIKYATPIVGDTGQMLVSLASAANTDNPAELDATVAFGPATDDAAVGRILAIDTGVTAGWVQLQCGAIGMADAGTTSFWA